MIKYVVGDVRNHPRDKEVVFIPHCCNDLGVMGSGVARALYEKWPTVRDKYLASHMMLGLVSYVKIDDGKTVICNMIGQRGVRVGEDESGRSIGEDGKPPVRYAALAFAMQDVASKIEMLQDRIEIHCPMFGCDLAGGDWYIVSTLIEEIWCPLCPVICCVIDESRIPKT